MVNPSHVFHVADYVIFSITIAVSLGIGLYFALSGGRQRTTSEYFVGNRRMAIIPVGISLMVSFESSIMMLGTPAEVYVYGFQWVIGNVGFFIANMLAIIIVVPLIHPLRITSTYEYLELRYKSRAVRTLGTILGMLSYSAYMGIVLFGPAIALEAVTGVPQWGSICCVAIASVIYTAIGGLKAVIWTDVFQAVVMFAGFFAVLIKGTMRIGGIGKTWEIAAEKGRLNVFNFDPDPTVRHTFWNLFIGSIIRGFGLVFNQSSVQRISSTPTIADARKVMMILAPGFFISLTLAAIEGIIAYGYYDTIGCDPLESDQITDPNQVVPYMVMDIFRGLPGMPGLFMASLFSASLSTLSSGLSSLSALFWTDLVKPHVKPMTELRATIISKIAVVFFGGVAVAISFLIAMVGGTLIQITGSVLSAFGAPLTGLFLFGVFCPWGNAKGAFWSAIVSAIFTFLICIGQMTTDGAVKNTKLPPAPIDMCPAVNASLVNIWVHNSTIQPEVNVSSLVDCIGCVMTAATTTAMPAYVTSVKAPIVDKELTGFRRLYMLSYQWFGVVGILVVIVLGSVISFLTGPNKPGDVDPKYLIPFYDRLFPWLPECILKPLRCGYDYQKRDKEDDYKVVPRDEDVININIDIDIEKPDTDTILMNSIGQDHMISATTVIAQSHDELRIARFPASHVELEILKTSDANSMEQLEAGRHIIIDKMDDNRVVKLVSDNLEMDILPIPMTNVPITKMENADGATSDQTAENPNKEIVLSNEIFSKDVSQNGEVNNARDGDEVQDSGDDVQADTDALLNVDDTQTRNDANNDSGCIEMTSVVSDSNADIDDDNDTISSEKVTLQNVAETSNECVDAGSVNIDTNLNK